METFEPRIVAFCCHYCAYTAADMAGSQRTQYPPNVIVIRVPCSGKVDSIHLLRTFEKGADGVYVAGCLDGDCHFKDGNLRADQHVAIARGILEQLGIEGERLDMFRMSAGMGDRFAEVASEMTERIRGLGPSPIRPPGGPDTPGQKENAAPPARGEDQP